MKCFSDKPAEKIEHFAVHAIWPRTDDQPAYLRVRKHTGIQLFYLFKRAVSIGIGLKIPHKTRRTRVTPPAEIQYLRLSGTLCRGLWHRTGRNSRCCRTYNLPCLLVRHDSGTKTAGKGYFLEPSAVFFLITLGSAVVRQAVPQGYILFSGFSISATRPQAVIF